MDDEQPPRVSVNGVDLSAFVKDFQTDSGEFDGRAFGESFPGLKPTGPITITGYWDDGRVTCGNCGARFMPGPEGTPTITHDPSGVSVVACPACAVALLSQ